MRKILIEKDEHICRMLFGGDALTDTIMAVTYDMKTRKWDGSVFCTVGIAVQTTAQITDCRGVAEQVIASLLRQ